MKRIPDTPIINEALQIVKAALSENIFNHSMRTYRYGCEFAEKSKKNLN
jgi:HD superfamily phosphohydrolase YqeK